MLCSVICKLFVTWQMFIGVEVIIRDYKIVCNTFLTSLIPDINKINYCSCNGSYILHLTNTGEKTDTQCEIKSFM